MAKQKQEIARKQLERKKERLEKKQVHQLKELEEENRQKLAKTKLTELELTDDWSQATDEFREIMSQISKHSKQNCVIEVNEPDSVSNQPQAKSVEFNNVAGLSNPAIIPASTDVVQIRQATPPVRSFANVISGPGQSQIQIPPIGVSSNSNILRPNSTPPSLAAVKPLPMFQLSTVNTTLNTVSSVTVPVVNLLLRLRQELKSTFQRATSYRTCQHGQFRLRVASPQYMLQFRSL